MFHVSVLNILSLEPSTGTVMGQVVDCDLEDFRRAIQSAYSIQKTFFSTTTGAARGAQLRKWGDLIVANKEDGETPIAPNETQDSVLLMSPVHKQSGHYSVPGKWQDIR